MKGGLPARAIPAILGLAAMAALPVQAESLHAQPDGYDEVPTLSSPAKAEFDAKIVRDDTEIRYELSYSGFPTAVQQAHIHLGRRGVNGGIGTQACPTPAGTITGVLTAANVIGPAAQGIAAGEFEEVVRVIREGAAYVNIHTAAFPGGEIRDQARSSRRHH
jgi:hypothetical protein